MRLRRGVEVAPARTALHAGSPAHRIDLHAAHARQVDDQATVAHGVSRHVVPASAHRDPQRVLTRERDGRRHVRFVRAQDDQGRPAIDHAVEHAARLVIAGVAWPQGAAHFAAASREDSIRGASDPTTAIRMAPASGGQNAGGIFPVASTSMPAENGPTKASR